MQVLVAQINPTIGDFKENYRLIERMLQSNRSFDIALFPELALSGYAPQDLIHEADFINQQQITLLQVAQLAPQQLVIIGGIDRDQNTLQLYNAAFVLHQGQVQAVYRKMCLPNYDVFNESRYFHPGTEPLIFSYRGWQIGLSICEDLWAYLDTPPYPHHPFSAYNQLDLIVNLSASPYEKGKAKRRSSVVRQAAVNTKSCVIMCCQVGAHDGILYDGGSLGYNPAGQLIFQSQFFEEDCQLVDINTPSQDQLENHELDLLEKGLVLGISDYFRKTGFHSALIGLSGGVDSALTLLLTVKAIGASRVHAFMIPSVFTSDMSLADSKALASSLQVAIHQAPLNKVLIEIEEMVKAQTSGRLKGITHENMQSRLRGMFLMAMSNEMNALVVTTGNKSELAVGYATLYGDMCGSFAPIGDLFKTEVYQLVRYLQEKEKIFPERILMRPPSAELKANQKDQDTLPPYELLDAILKLYIEENIPYKELITRCGFPQEIVQAMIKKFYQSEFKRQQYAPILKLSRKSLGPGRIVPIAHRYQPF